MTSAQNKRRSNKMEASQVAASRCQLLIGKSKPKVKIRLAEKIPVNMQVNIKRKRKFSQVKFTRNDCMPSVIISNCCGPRILFLISLWLMVLAFVCASCSASPAAQRYHLQRSERATTDATNGTANVTSDRIESLLFQQKSTARKPQFAGTRTTATTTSELSFEFLNLKSIPSNELCHIDGQDQVNSVSFADNRLESIQSSAFICISFRLKILNLRNNKIETISDDAFKGLNHLQVLILETNRLATVPAIQVSGSRLPSLRHLNLASNRIRAVGTSPPFEPSPHLISLNLKGNPIKSFHELAFSKLSSLKTLTLSQVDFQANHLGQFRGDLGELRFLHLDQFGTNLSSLGGSFCESSRKLAGLSLKSNQLKRVPQFTNCQSLISLDLSYNHIHGTLDGNLMGQSNLIDLYLGHNRLEYLGEHALAGLDKLQVLELKNNQLKTIHVNAFVPVRASLYELNIANNAHLISLPPGGLEGLISLKAYGNNQLRKLPASFPAAKLLALTYAYHCCDYYSQRGPNSNDAAATGRNPSLLSKESYTKSVSRTSARFSETARRAGSNRNNDDDDLDDSNFDGRQRDAGSSHSSDNSEFGTRNFKDDNDTGNDKSSLWLQLSHLIGSKLSRIWPQKNLRSRSSSREEEEAAQLDDGTRQQSLLAGGGARTRDDSASPRNVSELVLWPASARNESDDDNDEYSPSSSGGAENFLKSQVRELKIRVARQSGSSSSRKFQEPNERQVLAGEAARWPPRSSNSKEVLSSGVMIDELVLQMRRIRLAHSRDELNALPALPAIASDEPLLSDVLDATNDADQTRPEEEETTHETEAGITAARNQEADMVARALLLTSNGGKRALTRRSAQESGELRLPAARFIDKFQEEEDQEENSSSGVVCLPRPDAFQPCRDLFDSLWLRTSVWLVFLFAFLGNICVIVVLGSVRPSNSTSALTSIMWFNAAHSKRHIDVPRFLVLNLALADLLMACYLGILAFVDLSTLGEFRLFAIKWQYSTGCKLAGFLAVLSSELSVFILAIITLERQYAITNAVHLNRRLSLQKAALIMFFGYVYALAMALMPLNGINDYRKFSICLPLAFEPDKPLLESSSNLYLVSLISINTLSFVLLLSCYLRMYCAIRGSQAWNTNDLKIAKRMSILVVTDFLCWSPLICVTIASYLFGRYLVGTDGLKLLIIFVLPLNSVANPFLYAITTKKFKRDLAILKKRLRLEQAWQSVTRLAAGSHVACTCTQRGRGEHDHATGRSCGGGAGIHASTMDQQIYYRKTTTATNKRADKKLMKKSTKLLMMGGNVNNMMSSTQQQSRARAKQGGKQELAASNQNASQSGGPTRVGGATNSRLVKLNNRHNFQSFERNENVIDYSQRLEPATAVTARTHCVSCQRKLVAAAAASAFEPTILHSSAAAAAVHIQQPEDKTQKGGDNQRRHEGRPTSFLLQEGATVDRDRPRIVLDAVEPVVGVAMAPLRLVDNQASTLTTNALAATPISLQHTNSHSPAQSSIELGTDGMLRQNLLASDTLSQQLGFVYSSQHQQQQQRASSADNPARSNVGVSRPLHADNAVTTHHLSCQTVLVSDKMMTTRSMLTTPRCASNQITEDRSASACAFVWPSGPLANQKSTIVASNNNAAGSEETTTLLEANGIKRANSNTTGTTATCYSCSCDMLQAPRPAPQSALSHQSSNCLNDKGSSGTRAGRAVLQSRHTDRGNQQQQQQRASSINRLVFEPLAKAWSNLQLSLQSGLGGGALPQQTAPLNNNNLASNRADSTNKKLRLSSPVPDANDGPPTSSRTSAHVVVASTCAQERNRDLLLSLDDDSDDDDENESVIIEDILQMSSPAKRRLLGGRRMSRSCDVIIEQSSATTSGIHRLSTTSGTTTTGGGGEHTTTSGSSYYDQNDDQRILLATINQLNARHKKTTTMATRNTRRQRHARYVTKVGVAESRDQHVAALNTSGGRRAACTRCRSWSPALLDKLEDCMYQIKSRIPKFYMKELQREPSFEAMEQQQTATSSDAACRDECDQFDETQGGAQGETTSESACLGSSSSSSSSAIVEDEEDEFRECGLADWTRNMQKKAPVNCYAKSASRHRLRQQLSGNSDTLSGRTCGTTLTSVSFDSSSNIPVVISSSLGVGGADSNRQLDDESRAESRACVDKPEMRPDLNDSE